MSDRTRAAMIVLTVIVVILAVFVIARAVRAVNAEGLNYCRLLLRADPGSPYPSRFWLDCKPDPGSAYKRAWDWRYECRFGETTGRGRQIVSCIQDTPYAP